MADWIIIVDDNAADLQIAESTLTGIGIYTTVFKTGRELLDYLQQSKSVPDLLLISIRMQDMDGFETLKAVRHLQDSKAEIPVIFLSTDQEEASETTGFQMGAIDYIHKPINPDILTGRVHNALRTQKKLQRLERNAMIDRMTGFLNKDTVEGHMNAICQVETGFLCALDLDSFKLINDLYGHDMGDQVIVMFSNLLKNNMRSEDICGRIGGDEFLLFAKNMRTENELRRFTRRINQDYIEMMNQLFEDSIKFPIGVSIGAAAVPTHGREYPKLFHLADQALSTVKQTGKGRCALSGSPQIDTIDLSGKLNLETVTMILEERSISPNAMWMGREAFIHIYRYMMRYMERYQGVAYRVLFTVTPCQKITDNEQLVMITTEFRQLIQKSLRNSDVMVEVSDTQIFLLLPETHEMGINVVIDRLINNWNHSQFHESATITWEAGQVQLTVHDSPESQRTDWVVLSGDNGSELDSIEHMLDKHHFRVSRLDSAEALLGFLRGNKPDLILLNTGMPGMEVLKTLRKLKGSWQFRRIPILLITDDGTMQYEASGLRLGAEDYIRKPFVSEALMMRIRRIIDLAHCRHNYAHLSEMGNKTE